MIVKHTSCTVTKPAPTDFGGSVLNDRGYDPKIHHRRSIRLKEYDYSQPGAYFITICVHNRERIFGNIVNGNMKLNIYGKVVTTYWGNLSRNYPYLELRALVVMPNHVHGILVIKSDLAGKCKNHSIPDIVRSFKTFSSKRINELRNTKGIPLWQRNYWEHIIRNQSSFNRIYEYIMTNPLRWYLDKENPFCDGEDDFDHWLDSL